MSELVFQQIYLPIPLQLDVVVRLLERLFQHDIPRPLVLETRADESGLRYLVGTDDEHARRLAVLIEQQIPGARVGKGSNRSTVNAAARLRIRPPSLALDTTSLVPAIYGMYGVLASRQNTEAVVLQLSLGSGHRPSLVPQRPQDPTTTGLWRALVGSPQSTPHEVRASMKQRAGLVSVDATVRLGVSAALEDRRRSLAHAALGALRRLEAPGVRLDIAREQPSGLHRGLPKWNGNVRLTAPELAALTGWPIGDLELPGMPNAHPKRLAAPTNLTRTESVFATTTAPGDSRPVGIRPDGHLQHLVVTGPTGSGKSMVFAHLALADIAAGRPVVVIDPKRQLVDFLLDRIPTHAVGNVVVLDAADAPPVGFNPLDTEGRDPDVVVDGILSAFKAVFADGWGPRTEDILHASLLTLARAGQQRGLPYTLLELPTLLTDASFRRTAVGTVQSDPTLASFWATYDDMSAGARANIIAAPMNKLRKYLLRRNLAAVLGQPRPRFRLRDVFRESKAVLVPLNDALLGPGAAQLLGSLVTSELWMATLERAAETRPSARPASIYIDEVQQFLNLPTSIADALATSRSYGVSWNLAHQFREQLPSAMRAAFDANARSKVVFALPDADARDLARMAPELEREDFMALQPYEVYVQLVDQGAPTGWFSARTLPPTASTGTRSAVLGTSRSRYGFAPDAATSALSSDQTPPRSEPEAPTNRKARRA